MNPRQIDREQIADFCRRNHIRRLSLFGSALRSDFGPDSDVDVLVEFEANHIPGLGFFRMEEELEQLLLHPVDLNTPQCLGRYFREGVQCEAEVLYVG
jgi:predicted nucleotidyltransferase